jgi:hypothetical protein
VLIVLREEEIGGFTFVKECFLYSFIDSKAIGIQKKYNLKE